MFRRIDWLIAAIMSMLIAAAACGDDEVASYLERHGLHDLLARHLEQRLETMDDEAEIEATVDRLAEVYVRLLESTRDPERLAALQSRGEQLLERNHASDPDDLRLALIAGSYRQAERAAEQHRLRRVDESELDAAVQTFRDILPKLEEMRTRLEEDQQRARRRLESATSRQATARRRALDQIAQTRRRAVFLSGWGMYYLAWLEDDPALAEQAEQMFTQLLDPDADRLRPEDVTTDLRNVEGIARSILGMALCRTITSSTSDAMAWLNLLEHENTFDAVREEVDAWRLTVLSESGAYRRTLEELKQAIAQRDEAEAFPVSWLLLAAGPAIEADAGTEADGRRLIEYVIAELGLRGKLGIVQDLAQRYGVDALAGKGFAVRYVEAVDSYQDARERHGDDEPASDSSMRAAYRETADMFRDALAHPDAARFESASVACQQLIGWSLYFAGDYIDAADAFEAAEPDLPAEHRPQALWMAVLCLDQALREQETLEREQRMQRLADRFLDEYPEHENASRLVVRRIVTTDDRSPEAVAQLLNIKPDSGSYDQARRRAVQILYDLYSNADDEDAERQYGRQFLDVAMPLLDRTLRAAQSQEDDTLAQRYSAYGRWTLDVALDEQMQRLEDARRVLDGLELLYRSNLIDLSPIEAELTYRRLQLRLHGDDLAEAERLADELVDRAPESSWTQLAAQTLFRFARSRQQQIDDKDHLRRLDDMIVRFGQRVLDRFEQEPDALEKPAVMSYALTVVQARIRQWERTGDPDHAERTLEMLERIADHRPRDRTVLRGLGRLHDGLDQPEPALDAWRTLMAGSGVGTDAWHEARYHVIRLHLQLDPQRAREVMDQHVQLNPEYGPEPWGDRLRELDREIDVVLSADDDPEDPEDRDDAPEPEEDGDA